MKIRKSVFFLLLLLPPFVVISGLWFGNYINGVIPKLNFNPYGIGNEQWFLFWGSYLGGVCTLFALYFTLTSNQRATYYQAETLEISNEAKVISEVLSSFNLLFVDRVINEIGCIRIENGMFHEAQVIALLKSIIDEREKITSNQIRLSLESSIYQDGCKLCKNRTMCSKCKISIEFTEKYKNLFEKLYLSLNDLKEYVSIQNQNLKSKRDIYESDSILNNPTQYNDEIVKITFNNRENAQSQIKSDVESFEKIKLHVKDLEDIQTVQMATLIGCSKEYIAICRQNASQRMRGKKVPEFIMDFSTQTKPEQ